MNVCESLTFNANLFPDKVAIVFGDRQFNYSELDQLSRRGAKVLLDCGVEPGQRVALMLPNAPSFCVWYYAALRIGAIVVSVSTRLAAAEVEFVISDCDPSVFVLGSEIADEITSHANLGQSTTIVAIEHISGRPQSLAESDWPGARDQAADNQAAANELDNFNDWYAAEPDEPALILYTSGTTGFPKGATLSHGNVRSNVHAFNHLCNMQAGDVVLLAVPLFHCFGQNALLNSVLNAGGTLVLQQRFDLNESRQLIAQHRVNQLYGVPMMFGLLLESCSRSDLSSVEYCFSAAATLPIQTSERWLEKFGMPICEGYGLTETSPFATYNHRTKYECGSIGTAIDCVEVKVVDTETDQACAPGALGEIAIRGPNVMLGYWNRPAETAEAIRDGWFYSGDIGRVDERGFLFIVDRVKDMITIGGLKVFPAEVERVLLDHGSVCEAAVVGIPTAVLGEQVVAWVVLTDGQDSESLPEIESFAKANLGGYKVPSQFRVVQELPRNPSGKILKTTLREMATAGISGGSGDAEYAAGAQPAVEHAASRLHPPELAGLLNRAHASSRVSIATEYVQKLMAEIGQLESVPDPDVSFVEAGLDSLAIVELSTQIGHEVGPDHALSPTLLFDYPRVTELSDFLVDTICQSNPKTDSTTVTHGPEASVRAAKKPTQIRTEIEQLSEAEALAELMKELG